MYINNCAGNNGGGYFSKAEINFLINTIDQNDNNCALLQLLYYVNKCHNFQIRIFHPIFRQAFALPRLQKLQHSSKTNRLVFSNLMLIVLVEDQSYIDLLFREDHTFKYI